jgi:hypothetical protein
MLGSSRVAAQLAASQEGFSYVSKVVYPWYDAASEMISAENTKFCDNFQMVQSY